MPKDWRSLFGEIPGTAEFRRKFHCPTNLDPHECVMLVFMEIRGHGSVRLNDHPVGEFSADGKPIEWEITTKLSPFNVLAVEIFFDPRSDPSLSGGIYGAVALDIRS